MQNENQTGINVSDVVYTIQKLGISSNLFGFNYIRYAIELIAKDESYMHSITKRLYPEIARAFNSTSQRVERAIRHAIDVSMYRVNHEYWDMIFDGICTLDDVRPTNSEFLATLYTYLKYRC